VRHIPVSGRLAASPGTLPGRGLPWEENVTTVRSFHMARIDAASADALVRDLRALPGVENVDVFPDEGRVVVRCDADVVSDEELLAAIGREGFQPDGWGPA
jgi:copper chaperone CopZ